MQRVTGGGTILLPYVIGQQVVSYETYRYWAPLTPYVWVGLGHIVFKLPRTFDLPVPKNP